MKIKEDSHHVLESQPKLSMADQRELPTELTDIAFKPFTASSSLEAARNACITRKVPLCSVDGGIILSMGNVFETWATFRYKVGFCLFHSWSRPPVRGPSLTSAHTVRSLRDPEIDIKTSKSLRSGGHEFAKRSSVRPLTSSFLIKSCL